MEKERLRCPSRDVRFLRDGLGQVTNGTISGSVTDSTGAQVPDVQITATDIATSIVTRTTTGSGGLYSLPNLPIGTYEVRATRAGFATGVRAGVLLSVGREAVVDFSIKVGETTEQVVVTGDAACAG